MIENFSEKLKKYAELIVKVGVNVQKGQPVILYISITQQELAHLIVEEAYGAGASEVMIEWKDTFSEREFLKHASEERLENVPEYIVKKGNYIAEKKAARISVMSADPGAYSGIDQKRIAKNQAAMGKALRQVRKATQNNDLSWTVVSAADQAWAEKVFPEKKGQAAIDALWEEIFKTIRIDKADPVKAWHEHDQKLHEKSDWLNEQQFSALHYVSPVTDITIGLPENHVWEGAGSFTPEGTEFMANMPTEEVFTAPDCRRIDGYVKGQEVLEHLLETDAGAKSLGEVSLVPDPSPISQSGIIFFNTLFDENASDHLALGASYPFNVAEGTKMSDEELLDHGMNVSQTHVDFMVGSADMDIDGIKKDGTIVPVFRNGDWA